MSIRFSRNLVFVAIILAVMTGTLAVFSPIFYQVQADTDDDYLTLDVGGGNNLQTGASTTLTVSYYQDDGGVGVLQANAELQNVRVEFGNFVQGQGFQPCGDFDITAVGGDLTLQNPGNLDGDEDNRVEGVLNQGNAGSGQFTVTFQAWEPTNGCQVFAGGPQDLVDINHAADHPQGADHPGQNMQVLVVTATNNDPTDLDVREPDDGEGEVGEPLVFEIAQENSNGGLDVSPLGDVVIDVRGISVNEFPSMAIVSSGPHGLNLNDVIRFTSPQNQLVFEDNPFPIITANAIVAEVIDATHFRVVGGVQNLFGSGTQFTPQTVADGTTNAMGGDPGGILANESTNIDMAATDNMAVGNVVTIAGCAGRYVVTDVDDGVNISVIGPTPCVDPTGDGDVTNQDLTAGQQSAVTLENNSIFIVSAGGQATGNQTTRTLAGLSLTNGVIQVVIQSTEAGLGGVSAASATLGGIPESNGVAIGVEFPSQVYGYGPPSGQVGAPRNAPVDVFLSDDPTAEAGVNFPLANSLQSVLSITAGGNAITGVWHRVQETFQGNSFYKVFFEPQDNQGNPVLLAANTLHQVAISRAVASTLNLQGGAAPLVDGGPFWTFSFTTGGGGGDFDPNAGNQNVTHGGDIPPMAFLEFPRPFERDVATNSPIVIGFDRSMDATTVTTNTISVTLENGQAINGQNLDVELTPDGRLAIITGANLPVDTKVRVTATRAIRDEQGRQLAGMPEGGTSGFGFDNMVDSRWIFETDDGPTVFSADFTSTNLDAFTLNAGVYENVPPAQVIRLFFNGPINPATVNSANVQVLLNGIPQNVEVRSDIAARSLEIIPLAAYTASSTFTITVSNGVQTLSGEDLDPVNLLFETTAADNVGPTIVRAEFDQYGGRVFFSEEMAREEVRDKSNITLFTCDNGAVTDPNTCLQGGVPTSVGLLSARVDYFPANQEHSAHLAIGGLNLTEDQGFLVVLANVLDLSANGIQINPNDRWSDFVRDAERFDGGQGMQNMNNLQGENNNRNATEGGNFVAPENPVAGEPSIYTVKLFFNQAVSGNIELIFPSGTNVANAIQAPNRPVNSRWAHDLAVTFAAGDPAGSGLANGAANNDGIAVNAAANMIVVDPSVALPANTQITFQLSGIVNTTQTAAGGQSTGWKVDVRGLNADGTLAQAFRTEHGFFLMPRGDQTIQGQVLSGVTGINEVEVLLRCPGFERFIETALNAAGGGLDGEYQFTNIPDGVSCELGTPPTFMVGQDRYRGLRPIRLNVTGGTTTRDINITQLQAGNVATIPITITGSLNGIGRLGAQLNGDDTLAVIAHHRNGAFEATAVTRTNLAAHLANPANFPISLLLDQTGAWKIELAPYVPPNVPFERVEFDWMPSVPVEVSIQPGDLGQALPGVAFNLSGGSDVQGRVTDSDGNGVAFAEVVAYDPTQNTGNHAVTNGSGNFTLAVSAGSYQVFASKSCLPSGPEFSVRIDENDNAFVNGSAVASTGVQGNNPFVLSIPVDGDGASISGTITGSDGEPLGNASIWGYQSNGDGFFRCDTKQAGRFTAIVGDSAATRTWVIEAHGGPLGYFGSRQETMASGENLTNINFSPATVGNVGVVSGVVQEDGMPVEGAMVFAYGPNGGGDTTTGPNGAYSLNVPYGVVQIGAVLPEVYKYPVQQVNVNAAAINNINFNTPGATDDFTLTLQDSQLAPTTLSSDVVVRFFATNGGGLETEIPAGSSVVSVSLPEGQYNVEISVPGIDFSNLTVVGADINANQITIDGVGDDIAITLPTMRTISGTVTAGINPVAGAKVEATDNATRKRYSVLTANNGTYSLLVPDPNGVVAGGPSIGLIVIKKGFRSVPVDLTADQDRPNTDFVLTIPDNVVSGTVTTGQSVPIAGAVVHYREFGSAGVLTVKTGASGTYSIPAQGLGRIMITAAGKQLFGPRDVDTSGSSKTVNAQLTDLQQALASPKTQAISNSAGGVLAAGANSEYRVTVPPNGLGTGSDSTNLAMRVTNNIDSTQIVGDNGVEITGTQADGQPLTNLNNAVTVELDYVAADLIAAGITTTQQASQLIVSYQNDSSGMDSLPTVVQFLDSNGNTLSRASVLAEVNLTDAENNVDLATVRLVFLTTHFTVFAPTLPTGATPPATPAGISISNITQTSFVVTWTQNGEADMASYDVWETEVTEGIATNVLNAACQNNACTATLSSLSAGTAYGIQIIAIDADGNRSAGSTVVSTATLGTSGGRSPTTNRSSNNTTPSSTDSTVAAAPAPAPAGGGGGGSGGGATIAATSTHNAAATSPERTLHEGSIQTVLSAAVHAAAEDGNLEGSEGTAITAQTLLTRVFLSEAEDLRVLDLSAAPLQIAAEATELRGTDLSQQSSAQVALLTTAGASVRAVYLQEGSSWNGDFQAPRVVERSSAAVNVSNDEDLTGRDVSADNVTIVEVGAGAGVSLEFTSAQTLVMPAPAQADVGSTYEVYSSLDGTQWVRESGAVTYDASSGTVSLAISHATYFMVVAVDAEISTVRPVPKSYQPTSSVDDRSQRNIDREYAAQGMASQAWSKPYLEKLVERGIVEGNGRYEPQRSINRAEFLRIVLDALEVDLLTSTEKPFSDVDVSAWYASYVHTAKMNGWVKGYPDGTFGGGQFLNRAEAMVIIARVAGLNVDAATPSSLFTDVPRRSWFGPAVYYAYSQALVKGIGNDRFDPDSTLTKAQIAKIMVNLLYHLGRIE